METIWLGKNPLIPFLLYMLSNRCRYDFFFKNTLNLFWSTLVCRFEIMLNFKIFIKTWRNFENKRKTFRKNSLRTNDFFHTCISLIDRVLPFPLKRGFLDSNNIDLNEFGKITKRYSILFYCFVIFEISNPDFICKFFTQTSVFLIWIWLALDLNYVLFAVNRLIVLNNPLQDQSVKHVIFIFFVLKLYVVSC